MSAPERRQTPTERLHEVTMAAMNRRPSEPESSVEITRNARGVWQFSVTVRAADQQAAYEEALRLTRELDTRFPFEEPEKNGTATTEADKAAAKAAAIASRTVGRGGQ